MTPPSPRLSQALATIGWGPAMLSQKAGLNLRTVHRWIAGQNTPPGWLLDWLDDLSAYHAAHPPPTRCSGS